MNVGRLWDSLFAAILSPRTDPRDRADLIALVRAVHAIANSEVLRTVADVRRVLDAEPLMPARWFDGGSKASAGRAVTAPSEGCAAAPDGPSPEARMLTQANAFRQRYFDLGAAITELRLAERRALAAARRTRRASGAAGPTQPPPVAARPKPAAEPGSADWRLPAESIAALRQDTHRLIADTGRGFDHDSVTSVLAALEDEQALTVRRLHRVAGVRGLVNLDAEVKPELGPADLEPSTVEVAAGSDYEEHYEGSVGSIRPLGVGDLLVVRETLLRYELGQVAHVENVMQSERRERVYRQLDRVQTTYTTATETTETNEHDLQTTERFEMQTATAETIQSDTSISTGVEVAASYGPMVEVDASADFAVSSSTTDSKSSSTNYARDVTDRSVSSVVRSIQERMTTRTLTETEETNSHGFDNTDGTGHIVGIYRWLEKRYEAQVMNYGKRLMLEFLLPAPAEFYHYAAANASADGVVTEEPAPLPKNFLFTDVQPATYATWVKRYNVSDIDPPPPFYKTIGKAFDQPEMSHGINLNNDYILTTKTDTLTVPDGYRAVEAWVNFHATPGPSWTIRVSVGRHSFSLDLVDMYDVMENEDTVIPIAVKAFNVYGYALTVEVRCERTDAALEEWQLSVYQAIVTAYTNLKASYDANVTAAAVQQTAMASTRSPEANRLIELDELKKGCIILLTGQHFADAGAVDFTGTPFGYPEIRLNQAMTEGSFVQWIEQLCEWPQLTYRYYPYFWARKEDWPARRMLDDPDPLFAAFLKAGAARVLVPVRRTYEKALMYYLKTGLIWNGGAAPTIDNPHYVSIVEEMQAATDVALDDAVPYGEPWEYTLPTTLVMVQEDASLPVFVPPTP